MSDDVCIQSHLLQESLVYENYSGKGVNRNPDDQARILAPYKELTPEPGKMLAKV